MVIALNEPLAPSLFSRIINSVRIHNVPLLNFCIIGILGGFLIKLTTKYTGLYMKNSLITIIVTNLVLFGISETLAQTLLSYKPDVPFITFRISTNQSLSYNSNNIQMPSSFEPYRDNDDEEEEEDIEPDFLNQHQVNSFIDYIQRDDEEASIPYNPIFDQDVNPIPELTFFKFNRLAGFMCWGFLMAFCQCWWYKFLQIYAKDPKFIEVLRKVLTDQLCYSPLSLLAFFTYGTMVLENGSWQTAKDKLSKIYLKTLLINYSVWFPVQFINFLVIPRSLQVPFSSSISVLWNCFLSMRNSAN